MVKKIITLWLTFLMSVAVNITSISPETARRYAQETIDADFGITLEESNSDVRYFYNDFGRDFNEFVFCFHLTEAYCTSLENRNIWGGEDAKPVFRQYVERAIGMNPSSDMNTELAKMLDENDREQCHVALKHTETPGAYGDTQTYISLLLLNPTNDSLYWYVWDG